MAMKSYWYGDPIADMPREKLLEIIDDLGRELAEYRRPERIKAYAMGKLATMRAQIEVEYYSKISAALNGGNHER